MPLPHNMSYRLSIIGSMFLINPAMLSQNEYSLKHNKIVYGKKICAQ